jgi:membrane associated rhomboid family serine protease
MTYEITVNYTEALIRRITRRFVNRFLGLSFYLALGILGASALFFVIQGNTGWIVGLAGAVFGMGVAIVVLLHTVPIRSAVAILRRMPSQSTTFVFDDDGISIRNETGAGVGKWWVIKKVWKFPEAWLLFHAKNVYWTLPIAMVSEEMKAFIESKVKEGGGKVS